MVQSAIQTAFHTGEWSPNLYARVDLQKYHAAAALLRNFYVDYRGGASTRAGTRFINQCFKSGSPVRLVPFQPTSTTTYVLEFGDSYIRFFSNGAAVLETATTITGVTNANPGVVTDTTHGYSTGDWVFISGLGGITQLNGLYFIVQRIDANSYSLTDLFGNAINTTTYGVFSANGKAQRVFTLNSPFAASDLFPNPATGNPGIKFVQDVASLIICHPSYQPQILTITSAANWTISTINFGATIATPTISSLVSNLTVTPSNWNYAYTLTAVDVNGQESPAATPSTLIGFSSLASTASPGSNTLTWTAVPGAISYNVYKANPVFNVAFPTVPPFGFIGNTTQLTFTDATPGIGADFAQTPPVVQNPFQGAGVNSYTVTAQGPGYTAVPSVTVAAPPAGGFPATAAASLGVTSATLSGNGQIRTLGGNPVGSVLIFPNGVTFLILTTTFIFSDGSGTVWSGTYALQTPGSITGAGTATPSNPVAATGCSFSGFVSFPVPITETLTWGVTQVNPVQIGAGYTTVPAVTFSAGAAAATAVLGTASQGNPGVPGFLQERLALAGLSQGPMTFDLSQPGSFFNYNVNNPVAPDDAITGTIFSGELNDIKSLTPVPTGLLVLSGRLAWIINGGGGLSAYNPITPANAVANPQTFTGANDLPPLKINQDLLYVTNKGSYVRDLNYNIYANVFAGQDISVMSSHLFFNHHLTQWAWAEEPFKTAWAIRDDGILLSLAYVKEQELMGWSHHDTNGQFMSVCTVLETNSGNTVDAAYVVVKRLIQSQTVQYVERLTDRYFPYGKEDAWSVDAGLQTTAAVMPLSGVVTITGNASVVGNTVTLSDTSNSPFTATMATNNYIVRAGGGIYKITVFTNSSTVTATVVRVPPLINLYTNAPFPVTTGYGIWQPITTVTNLTQLIGQTVTGVADGTVINGTVSSTGSLALGGTFTKVTIGLAFTPQLQTLPLDLGSPTIQGRPKQINAVTVRVADTLGLSIGSAFSTIVAMKESQLNNQNYYLNAVVSDFIDADTRTQLDSTWTIPGQYCIQQTLPYPATILGVIPEFAATQRQG